MENDNTETVPKGEIPTEAEFARLLCDKTFVDYFNAFLSLPVFSQRLLYRFTEQTFELDPPIKRTQYRLDRLKLMRWVRTERAPLFFKTDLFLEYLLCKQLQKTQLHLSCPYGSDQTSAKDRMLDRRLMSRWLSRVSGMRKFRSFLEQTAGEKALRFWLDAERFRKTTHCPEEHRVLFRQIEAKYFKHGGMLELPEHAKWLASVKPEQRDEPSPSSVVPGSRRRERRQSHFIGSGVEVESRLPGGSLYGDSHEWLIAPEAFTVIQGFFLKTLQNYWVPRYLIHCKTKWFKHRLPQIRGEVSVYRPNSYAVKVRSLSDLADEDETEAAEGAVKTKQVVRVGSRLKKQSAFNLLSMFSSPGVRRSELATILKLEDTGETLGAKAETETGRPDAEDEGWRTEDVPLPTISEESGVSEESRKSSAKTRSSCSPGFATPSPRAATPEKIRSTTTSPSKSPEEGAKPAATDAPTVLSPDGRKERVQKELRFEEPTESRKGSPAPLDESTEERLTPSSAKGRRSSDITGLSTVDTDKLLSRFPPGGAGRMRRSSVAVPYQISRDSSLSSVGRSSISGDSIHTPSLRRMSLQSGTGLEPSSSSISGSRGGAPTTPKKPKPPRRARAMSMEFRLADFSMMIKSLDATGGAAGASSDASELDKIAAIGLPQLEADIEALQTQKEQEERRKAERTSKKHRRRGSVAEGEEEPAGGKLGKKGLKDGKGLDALRKGYRQRSRRGSVAFKPSGKQLAQLTRANLAMLEASHRGKWKPPSLTSRKSTAREAGKPGFGHRLGKYGLHKLDIEEVAEPTKDYNTLTFQEKLDQDARKLVRIPLLSPSQILRPTSAGKEAVERLAEFTRDTTFSIGPKLPNINAEVHLKPPAAMSICRPSYRGYGLGEINYRQKHRLLVGAISADKLAGNPFYSFLQQHNLETELRYLKFWQTAQEYLTTGTYTSDIEGSFSRHRLARQIKATFLTQTGESCINLGDSLANELCGQMPQDTADELVVHAQNLACEALRQCLSNFQSYDLEDFLSKTTSKKNFRLDAYSRPKTRPTGFPEQLPQREGSTDRLLSAETSSHVINQLVKTARESEAEGEETAGRRTLEEGTVNALAPYRMWRALQLAESASRVVVEPAVVSDPSDPDSDSEDEGSLRRKLVTVYRKRKPKPVKDVGPRPSFGPVSRGEISIQRAVQGKESKHSPDDEALGSGKAVCRAIRKDGRTIHRPPRPKAFQEVLRDSGHQEFLKRFLAQKKSDLPLLFWQAVENMKTTCRDAKSRQSKTIMIVRKFFCKATDFGNALQCDADIIQDIPQLEKVTPQMLMSAQACVAKSMEEKWFEQYQDTFPEEASDEESEEGSTEAEEKLAPRDKNKALWAMFINNVTSFRRGLMNKATMNAFKTFFDKEVQREMEKQKQTGVQSKRMISNKVIIVDKLKNDLSFWAEVERFKDLADSAARAAASGTYTIDDEEYVQKKAKAIIDCYIDSQVPPKLQINTSQEIADEILDTAENGIIERGLFHDAAVSIFSVLLYCWKKFCRERFAPPSKKSSRITVSTEPAKKRRRKRKRHPSTPRVAGVKIKTITGTSVDDPPKMQFTLQTGIQLILPPKPPTIDQERLRAMIRQLYPNDASLDAANGDEKLLQLYHAAQQLHAQQQQQHQQQQHGYGSHAQRRLSRSIGQHLQMAAKHLLPGAHHNF